MYHKILCNRYNRIETNIKVIEKRKGDIIHSTINQRT